MAEERKSFWFTPRFNRVDFYGLALTIILLREGLLYGAAALLIAAAVSTWGEQAATRKDGTSTDLLVWQTTCPECGSHFEVLRGGELK